jgi:large subunit ribosomal protein L35
MKTHSATKKRFKISGTGKVMFKKSGRSHLLACKNAKRRRSLRRKGILPACVEGHIKRVMPYA